MRMTLKQVRLYNQQFDAEMSAMSVDECRRWNPHLSEQDAVDILARSRARCTKHGATHRDQQELF